MAKNNVKVVFQGEDNTGSAAAKAKSSIKSVGDQAGTSSLSLKKLGGAIAGAFAVDALKEFLTASLQIASQSNPALKKSSEALTNQFKGLQVGVGSAILGNTEFMTTLSQLATGVIPVVVNAMQVVIGIVNVMISVVKAGFTNLSILFKLIKGEISLKEAFNEFKDNATNTYGAVKDTAVKTFGDIKTAWDTDFAKVGSTATGAPDKKAITKAATLALQSRLEISKQRVDELLSFTTLTEDQVNILRAFHDTAGRLSEQAIVRAALLRSQAFNEENAQLRQQLETKAQTEIKSALDLESKKKEIAERFAIKKGPLSGGGVNNSTFDSGVRGNVANVGIDLDTTSVMRDTNALMASISQQGIPFANAFSDALGPLSTMQDSLGGIQTMLGELSGNLLVNLTQGFANAFEAIGQGVPVFAALGKAAKDAIIQAAAAQGREQFARGTAALASGFMGAPNAFPAAAKHFAAGAAFMSLAGLGGGSGGRGGGGVSGAIDDRDNIVRPDTLSQGEATITIVGGLLDMSNPEQARALTNAMQKLSNRRINLVVGGTN